MGCITSPTVANAGDIFDLFGEDFIKMYEEEIVHKQVVSQLTDDELKKTADELGITTDKLRKVMLLQHAFASAGNDYTLQQILDMKTGEVLKNTKALFEHLKKTLPEDDYKKVEAKFKQAMQNSLKKK